MMTVNTWVINDKHPMFGVVKAMGVKEGEPYRMFLNDRGNVSLIPLDCLLEK